MTTPTFAVVEADFEDHALVAFLREHLDDIASTAPDESRHALDVDALRDPSVQMGLLKVWLTPDLWGRGVPAGRMSTCLHPIPRSSVTTWSR